MKCFQVAIIGMGKMGKTRLRELEKHPGFNPVAVCDVDEKNLTDFSHLKRTKDWKDLTHMKLDAVFVCTFNDMIPVMAIEFLKLGLHVFAEKPPGRNKKDVEDIARTYLEEKKENQVLKFGFNHRFHYAVIEAKSLIDSGRYGKLLWARGVYGKAGGESYLKNWRLNPEVAGGGILLDQGIHMIDLVNFFIGNFSEVKSFVDTCFWKEGQLEDNAFALLKNTRGQYAMVHSSATQWRHKFNLDLHLEGGYVCLNGILSSTRSYGEESITFAKRQFESEWTATGRPREETIYFDQDDSWKLEIDDFYQCLTGEKKEWDGNVRDALDAMRVVDLIYRSGKKSGDRFIQSTEHKTFDYAPQSREISP